MSESKKKIIKKYSFIAFILICITLAIFLMVRYQSEGERNVPYKLSKILIKSTIDAKSIESENLWDVDLAQNNDIYIYIDKNENYKKEEKIKSIKLENIKIVKENKIGELSILLPTSNDVKKTYENSQTNYIGKTIEYSGNSIDNMELQEICQNGGTLAFRISNKNIGKYTSNEGDELQYNGTLLQKSNINEEDLKVSIKADFIIETENSKAYKTQIEIQVPAKEFGESGIVNREITDFSKLVYKRM